MLSYLSRRWFRLLLTLLLLLGWLGAMVWAFWWFEGRYVRAFERPAFFSAEQVAPPSEEPRIQVVHVWRADCPCNGGHQDYIEDMTERFSSQGVLFARAGQKEAERLPAALKSLPYWSIPEQWAHWPGAPSVAIWDAEGRLAYVGPYSDGAHCTTDSSFIEPVISALLEGRRVSIHAQDAVACLCDLD